MTGSLAVSPGVSTALDPAQPPSALERLPIVITGHVDHGKSTIIGRLLVDTGSLPQGKLEAVRAACERNAKPFEYAFILDALKDEQAQGITIDAARVFFKSSRRHYMIIDAPGHVEFLKNMITGAARAQAALLVIDAHEGIRENSRRHGYLLSMLGIRQVAVLINKMDLVERGCTVFERISSEYVAFLAQLGITPRHVIPVSGFLGENVVTRAETMAWYEGPTVLEALDAFAAEEVPIHRPFRMPVQGVYKFTLRNDTRRIVAGTVETGLLAVGDEVMFYPSGKRSRVRSIEAFNRRPRSQIGAAEAVGFTLDEQIYVMRGEIATRIDEPAPEVSTRFRASLFWLGRAPFASHKDYVLKLGTSRVRARIEAIHRVIDASDLASFEGRQTVERHEVAECTLTLDRPLAFDTAENCSGTARFVVVDDFEISGGGIIREALPDRQSRARDTIRRRNMNWAGSDVPPERRAERLGQRPALLLITGEQWTDRKRFARRLETRLFDDGRFVYFLAIGNILYGVDADLDRTDENRGEHVRRLGEVANILLETGLIVVVTAVAITQEELELLRTVVGADKVAAVWIGKPGASDIVPDLMMTEEDAEHDGTSLLKALLWDRGVIFKP